MDHVSTSRCISFLPFSSHDCCWAKAVWQQIAHRACLFYRRHVWHFASSTALHYTILYCSVRCLGIRHWVRHHERSSTQSRNRPGDLSLPPSLPLSLSLSLSLSISISFSLFPIYIPSCSFCISLYLSTLYYIYLLFLRFLRRMICDMMCCDAMRLRIKKRTT